MPTRRVLILTALAALALAGCGRKGPLDLPADVRAERAARAAAAPPAPGSPPRPPLGDVGNRPPAQYPFFLDPLL